MEKMNQELAKVQQFSAHRYPPLAFSVFRLPKEPLNLMFIVVDSDKSNEKSKEV